MTPLKTFSSILMINLANLDPYLHFLAKKI